MAASRHLKTLVIDHTVPAPDKNGASVRMVALLQMLRELACDVSFIPLIPESLPQNAPSLQQDTERLLEMGVNVVGVAEAGSVGEYLAQQGRSIDLVLLSGGVYAASKQMDNVRAYAPQAFLLYDTTDLQYLREFREARLSKNGLRLRSAVESKAAELHATRLADCTLTVSELEQQILARECPGAWIEVLPNIHEITSGGLGFDERQDMFFVGNFDHRPNPDAMVYYGAEIHSLVQGRLPGVKLYIVGTEPPPEVQQLANSTIIVTGHIPNLNTMYRARRLSIAPLRFGAGVKGKILASMGAGLPAVVSSIGAEGIPAEEGSDLLIADDPAEFADAIFRAYSDRELWQRLAINGQRVVHDHYSYSVVKERLAQILAVVWQRTAEA